MPPAIPLSTLNVLGRSAVANLSTSLEVAQLQPLQILCAWPISGQYSVGSRILYYVLVAACLLARKTEWLRNACLAAALIFPAVAAIHGIVLAAMHIPGKVDMDLYGALQLCSIGILTAPVTARLSKTYFNNPGRNTIFAWTVLVLAGLLALTAEFFRSNTVPCSDNGFGQPIYDIADFHDGETMCGLTCTVDQGPFSPMREGSADNIYVIPAPHIITFGAATLIAAASCIPAILSMVSMWDKIVKINWKERFGYPDDPVDPNELIEGTNATVGKMKKVNEKIREFLSVVEVPLFGGAVLALIVVGELNFWSRPVEYQTEPIANIGQWGPIVASVMAACGSLYMLMAKHKGADDHEGHCACPCHEHGSSSQDPRSDDDETEDMPQSQQPGTTPVTATICRRDTSPSRFLAPIRTITQPDEHDSHTTGLGLQMVETGSSSAGKRPEVARILSNIAEKFGTASPDRYNDYEFKHGKATGFPEIPGEENRNSKLIQIKEQWGQHDPDGDDALTPRGRSRANSFNGDDALNPRGRSRAHSFSSISRSHSPQPPKTPTGTSFLGLQMTESPKASSESVFPLQPSADLKKPNSPTIVVTLHSAAGSPDIVLSSDDEPNDASGFGAASSPTADKTAP